MMKKTLLSAAVVAAMGMPFTVNAAGEVGGDAFGSTESSWSGNGATSEGSLSAATNTPLSSYNGIYTDSNNVSMKDAYNETNSDNLVDIAEDGNVIFAQQADQAVATADMDGIVAGNEVVIDGASSDGALSGPTNSSLDNLRTERNSIGQAFSSAAGIALVSQNTGHTSSIQQSTIVQSNFSLN